MYVGRQAGLTIIVTTSSTDINVTIIRTSISCKDISHPSYSSYTLSHRDSQCIQESLLDAPRRSRHIPTCRWTKQYLLTLGRE